jgi:hypothetical protein
VSIHDLLGIASEPTGPENGAIDSSIPSDLMNLLTLRNGFFAFESALEVFPLSDSELSYTVSKWNEEGNWRKCYHDLMPDGICFAQDVFGGQFIYANSILRFDPETALSENFAASIDQWATLIMTDYEYLLGYPIAREWQAVNGQIPFFHRLVPKIPFVLGGEYGLDNLVSMETAKSMRFRADLALQIKNLPDGAEIVFKIVD